MDRDYVVKFNGILCGSEWFKKKTKKERFSCGSQVSQLICGNMNQEAEEGKEIQTQCLDDQILEDKRMSLEKSMPLKKICLTVFCQMWYLEENLGMYPKCQRLL